MMIYIQKRRKKERKEAKNRKNKEKYAKVSNMDTNDIMYFKREFLEISHKSRKLTDDSCLIACDDDNLDFNKVRHFFFFFA